MDHFFIVFSTIYTETINMFLQKIVEFFKTKFYRSPEKKEEKGVISGTKTPSPWWYNNIVVLLDNGHASRTPGKHSPKFEDGSRFYEYAFNRDIVKRIASELQKIGIKYHILVPEIEYDVPLSERAARANSYAATYGKDNCVFISVHANAFGNGETWNNARGWSIYTTKGQTKSDNYATIFFEEAEKLLPYFHMTLRKDMGDGDPDYEENFTVLYKTVMPAVLTENLFFTNKTDVDFLMSEEGKNVIAKIHVNAIKRICTKK